MILNAPQPRTHLGGIGRGELHVVLLRQLTVAGLHATVSAAAHGLELPDPAHLFEVAIPAPGMPAVLPPPPEEVKQVETAIGASRAQQQRDKML